MNNTILLTGGNGYLGSHILKELIHNHEVILLKRSFSNTTRITNYLPDVTTYDADKVPLENIFKETEISTILHCATNYGRGEIDPLQVIEANLLLPLSLLELGKKYKIHRFINTDTILDKKINHYSLSKKQFKEWLTTYNKELVCINVALEHFYGEHDDKTKFVSNIVDRLLKNVDHIDLTLGAQERDFIYIDDTVNAFVTIVDKFTSNQNGFYEFEVGSNENVSIRDFVELAKRVSGNTTTTLNFGALPYRENEVMSCNANTENIKRLGWTCNTSLKDGLNKMITAEKMII